MMKSLNHRLAKSLVIVFAGLTLAACAGLTPSDNGLLARDMLEIKNKLNEVAANQSSSDRMLEAALSGIDVSLQDREDIVKNVIDDMEKRMREQNDEIQRVRAQLQEMTFALDSLNKRLGMSSTAGNSAGNSAAGPAGTNDSRTGMSDMTGDGAAPTTGTQPQLSGAAVDQAISSAMRQYSIGNFTAAREGFRQALEQQPDDEKKVEILFWLGETCNQLEDYPVALENYWAVINLKPDHIRAWKSLERMAEIKEKQGDLPRALELLQQIESIYPTYPDIEDVKTRIGEIQAQMAPPEPTPEPAPEQPTGQPTPPPSVPSAPGP